MTLLQIVFGRVRRGDGSPGQGIAEFAVVFPVLMLIIGGIIQFGVIFWGQNTLNQVVRDTGRWAATQTNCDPLTAKAPVVTTANQIAAASNLIGFAPNSILDGEVTVSWRAEPPSGPCPPADNQDEAWVTITIQHDVPVFFPFVPGSGHLSASTEYRLEPLPE
jgi:Flp pilus assembly protein TadG